MPRSLVHVLALSRMPLLVSPASSAAGAAVPSRWRRARRSRVFHRRGFTMVELAAALTGLLVLTAVAAVTFVGFNSASRLEQGDLQLQRAVNAELAFFQDWNTLSAFPSDLSRYLGRELTLVQTASTGLETLSVAEGTSGAIAFAVLADTDGTDKLCRAVRIALEGGAAQVTDVTLNPATTNCVATEALAGGDAPVTATSKLW